MDDLIGRDEALGDPDGLKAVRARQGAVVVVVVEPPTRAVVVLDEVEVEESVGTVPGVVDGSPVAPGLEVVEDEGATSLVWVVSGAVVEVVEGTTDTGTGTTRGAGVRTSR